MGRENGFARICIFEAVIELRLGLGELTALMFELGLIEGELLHLLLNVGVLSFVFGEGLVVLCPFLAPGIRLIYLSTALVLERFEHVRHVDELALVDGIFQASPLAIAGIKLFEFALLAR